MRVLFSCNPGLGHVLPLLPLALAARAAGHEVAFLAGASVGDTVRHHGFAFHEAGPPDIATILAGIPEAVGQTGRRHAMLVWSRGFAGVTATALASAMLELAARWRPDIVVHDDSEQGTWIAAERLGIPHVALQVTAWRSTGIRLSAESLGRLRAAHALPPDPDLDRWHRNGFIATRPPSLVHPSDPLPATAVGMRPVALDAVDGPAPAWVATPPPTGRISLTLGTILPGRDATILRLAQGLATLGREVVATTGGVTPAEAADGMVRTAAYIPMSELLPTCDVVVFHGGSGTLLAAMAAGVPVVMLPTAADQPANADAVAAAGAGVALPPDGRDVGDVVDATRRVLDESGYRATAGRIAAEINRMPEPAALVPALDRLAAAGPDGMLAAPAGPA